MTLAIQIGLLAAAAAAVLLGLYAFALLDRARRREGRILGALAACDQAHQILLADFHVALELAQALSNETMLLAARCLHPEDAGPLCDRISGSWRQAAARIASATAPPSGDSQRPGQA